MFDYAVRCVYCVCAIKQMISIQFFFFVFPMQSMFPCIFDAILFCTAIQNQVDSFFTLL